MRLKRIGVLSSGLVIGILYAFFGLIAGGIFSLFAIFGAALGAAFDEVGAGAMGAVFGIGGIVFFPIFYGVLGFFFGLIIALLYNLVARITGGVEMHFEKIP